MFSSRSFIVLHFTFRFVIHFELIFVKGVRSVSRLIILNVDVQLFQHHLLKRLPLLHCIASAPLLIIFMEIYIWALCSVPLIYSSIISPVPHCHDYYNFIVSCEVR